MVGGPRQRDATPLVDRLTGVGPNPDGDLRTQLLRLRRVRGEATSLVVVTGELDVGELPYVAALRRRFDRLVLLSLDPGHTFVPDFHTVRVIVGARRRRGGSGVGAAGGPVIRRAVPFAVLPLAVVACALAGGAVAAGVRVVDAVGAAVRRGAAQRADSRWSSSASACAGCGSPRSSTC